VCAHAFGALGAHFMFYGPSLYSSLRVAVLRVNTRYGTTFPDLRSASQITEIEKLGNLLMPHAMFELLLYRKE
jgi:hypothetical protein